MKVSDYLAGVREEYLLAPLPPHGTYVAEDEDGNDVAPRSPEAVRWCVIGAEYRCREGVTASVFRAGRAAIILAFHDNRLMDRHPNTPARGVAIIEAAIRRAKRDERRAAEDAEDAAVAVA